MKFKDQTVLIVGGGAAGLMAAKRLAKHCKVVILEANSRIGGRIATIVDHGFSETIEAGAEFIHGKLPLTLRLLKKGDIPYVKLQGKMWSVQDGTWKEQEEISEDWDMLLQQMKKLRKDIPLAAFLTKNFAGQEHQGLRDHAIAYAEGFDLADVNKVSTKTLYREWSNISDSVYRVTGGHQQLVTYMAGAVAKRGGEIITNSVVNQIDWERNHVTVYTTDNKKYEANKCLVTIPLGKIKGTVDSPGLKITPALDEKISAIGEIGFGSVVKVVIEFREAFWNEVADEAGFIFSNELFPTWWTQHPSAHAVLTGWKGGPGALELSKCTDEQIFMMAIDSLAAIFKLNDSTIREKIQHSMIFNWGKNQYAGGAYSFAYPTSLKTRKELNTSVRDTIYFAGEGIHEGSSAGTVEAALQSGKKAAERIIKESGRV